MSDLMKIKQILTLSLKLNAKKIYLMLYYMGTL